MPAAVGDNINNIDSSNIIFTIKDTKLYVQVGTLSARDNQKLTARTSKGFERSVYWNQYKKSENKIKTNEYRNFLESNFVGVNRLFVLVYRNHGENTKRIIYQKT